MPRANDVIDEFRRSAAKALEGVTPQQLAPTLAFSEARQVLGESRFTFENWPRICAALGRDPIDELVRGRSILRQEEDNAREAAYRAMLERAEADTMVSLAKHLSLSREERIHVARQLMGDDGSSEEG